MMIRRNMRKVLAVLLAASISISNVYVPVYAQEMTIPTEEQTVQEEIMTDTVGVCEETVESISVSDSDIMEDLTEEENSVSKTENISEADVKNEEITSTECTTDTANTLDIIQSESVTETETVTIDAVEVTSVAEIETETITEASTENITELSTEVPAALKYCSEYITDDYKVSVKVDSIWESSYNATVTITNISDITMENWNLKFSSADEIINIWDAEITSRFGESYVLTNRLYNADIAPQESVTFGFTANYTDEPHLPAEYTIEAILSVVMEGLYEITCKTSSMWSDGYVMNITITNLGNECLEDWVLSFDSADEIINIWNAGTDSYEDNRYVIHNAGHNANIEGGSSVTFGFQVKFNENTDMPDEFVLKSMKQEPDYSLDTDEDGIPDYDEVLLGTDPKSDDSDNDGLKDYDELNYGYNPQNPDSDGNGVSDGSEDYDRDGINNSDEYVHGTKVGSDDTDRDNLTDYDELFVYGTNPLMPDSDNDGVYDDSELKYGLDPWDTDSNNNGVSDKDDTVTYRFDISEIHLYYDDLVYPVMNLSGTPAVLDSFEIEMSDNNALINYEVPGYIGNAYEFTVSETFESAELTFILDESLYAQENFQPAIYYYNEEQQMFEYVEGQISDGKDITVNLEHFSRYIVLNKLEYDKVFENDIAYTNASGKLDLILAIDASGSMGWNDASNIRLQLSKSFVDLMDEDDSVGVVRFESTAKLIQPLTSDKELAKQAISGIYASGGTVMYDAIGIAEEHLLEYSPEENRKIIIVLTDGDSTYSYDYPMSSLTQTAKENDIEIYTIGLGSAVNTSILNSFATQTGGKYYHASYASNMKDAFDEVKKDTIDIGEDTNDDDLSDYYTKLICEGKLETKTGINVFGGYSYADVMANDDLDEDGLKNGEEIIIKEYSNCAYVEMISDPRLKNSDADIYMDYAEVKVYNSNPLNNEVLFNDSVIEYLGNSDYYYASIYEKEFEDRWDKQILTWIGNNVYGSNYNKTEIYKEMLVDYFTGISNFSNEDGAKHLDTATFLYTLLNETYYTLNGARERNSLTTSEEVIDDLLREVRILQTDLNDYMVTHGILTFEMHNDICHRLFNNVLVKMEDLNIKLASYDKLFNKLLNKVWDKFVNVLNSDKTKKLSTILGHGVNIFSMSLATANSIYDLDELMYNIETIQENIYVLEVLSQNAADDNMKNAANILYEVAENIIYSWISSLMYVTIEASADTFMNWLYIEIHTDIVSICPSLFFIDLALVTSETMFGVSNVSKCALRTCAASDMSMYLYTDLYKILIEYGNVCVNGGNIYHSISVDDYVMCATRFINLFGSRIFGEQQVISLESDTVALAWISEWLNIDKSDVINDCNWVISYLNNLLNKILMRQKNA